jgi:hypothetical protein
MSNCHIFTPNYAIGLPNILLMLGSWVFAVHLKYTQKYIDQYSMGE